MLKNHERARYRLLGEINVSKIWIDQVPNAKLFKTPPLCEGPKTLERTEIDSPLRVGVVEPSMSEFPASVLYVRKNDGKIRYCIDWSNCNSINDKDTYSFPWTDKCIEKRDLVQYFKTCDPFLGNWQKNLRKRTDIMPRFSATQKRSIA